MCLTDREMAEKRLSIVKKIDLLFESSSSYPSDYPTDFSWQLDGAARLYLTKKCKFYWYIMGHNVSSSSVSLDKILELVSSSTREKIIFNMDIFNDGC